MKKNLAVAFALVAATLIAPLSRAADAGADVTDMQALQSAVKADKRAYVASVLKLSDAEAKKFWPIYDSYQRNLEVTSRRRVVAVEALLFHDKPMSNLGAKNLITELMAVDEAEVKARRTLRNRVMRALPPLKAARYLQLESKFEAVQEYDIASTVPLIR